MERINFKLCGECVACCDGHLIGNSHGNKFGMGRQCLFLVEKKCSIYDNRPGTCKKFQCGWTQGLFSDKLYPLTSNVMVSVEIDADKQKQFLRVIELSDTISDDVYKEIDDFCFNNSTYFIRVPYVKTIPLKVINE